MARYPYHPGLPTPGKWGGIDYTDPKMEGALRMMTRNFREETASFSPSAGVRLEKKRLDAWDGETLECYVFSPADAPNAIPAMLYCHGGGFFLPIQPYMMQLAAEYAAGLRIRVYLPEYRLLPNPYPFRDCLRVLEHIQERNDPYLLYGESAGGTLAAGLALWARDQDSAPARGQCLIYPVMDNRCSRYPSMRQYSEAAWSLKNNLAMWRTYLKNGKDGLDDYLIPMTAPDVSRLPQAYIEAQQIDTLRDEAIAYGVRLREADVEVNVSVIEGSYHGFDAAVDTPFVKHIVSNRIEIMKSMINE